MVGEVRSHLIVERTRKFIDFVSSSARSMPGAAGPCVRQKGAVSHRVLCKAAGRLYRWTILGTVVAVVSPRVMTLIQNLLNARIRKRFE